MIDNSLTKKVFGNFSGRFIQRLFRKDNYGGFHFSG